MVKKIGIIVGSLRKDSFNRKTANTFVELLPEGYQADFLEIGDLPLYNEDLDVEGKIPESWTRFRTELKQVEGVFFFTPEYNRSMPASIKKSVRCRFSPLW